MSWLFKNKINNLDDLINKKQLYKYKCELWPQLTTVVKNLGNIDLFIVDESIINEIYNIVKNINICEVNLLRRNVLYLNDWKYSIYIIKDLYGIVEMQNHLKNIYKNNSKMDYVNFSIKEILTKTNININEIKQKYPNLELTSRGSVIKTQIIPQFVLYGHNSHFEKIDSSLNVNIINTLEIILTNQENITSVILDNDHPNANKIRMYCLGNFKFSNFNLNTLDKIINSIRIYNLTDCYYIPKGFEKYIHKGDKYI